jgi:hypothetical protein
VTVEGSRERVDETREQAARPGSPVRRPRAGASPLAGVLAVPALLLVVVALGTTLRLTGVDWDDGAHLHPDERYVTMVATAVEWPGSLREYFDVRSSPLSPYSTEVGRGYLYGQLPLVATKAVATALGRDGYAELHLVGRTLSALLDAVSIVLVFVLARALLAGRTAEARAAGALTAAAFYALSVTAIQHAHFFTMESWLVATTLLVLVLATRLAAGAPTGIAAGALLAGVGAAVGLTAATKISGLLVAIPVVVALAAFAVRAPAGSSRARAAMAAASPLVVALAAYGTYRLVSPYAFAHSSWLRPEPNADFRHALEAQSAALGGKFLFPPAYQWLLSTPWLDPLRNLLGWGLGLPLGLLALAGFVVLAARSVDAARHGGRLDPAPVAALMVTAFVAVTFAYFASRFAHSIRYLLPVVPPLCAGAAYALVALHARRARLATAMGAAVLAATVVYAFAFVSIYRAPNTRIAASEWLLRNVEPGSTIVTEHWDDALPVHVAPDRFRRVELPVFDPDDDAKLTKLHDGLASADVYVLSSPRAWRTIGRLPELFPLMTRFYAELRNGRLGFREVARFESPPRLLGLTIDDLGAEEPFWIYDHPPVIVFARDRPVLRGEFERTVCRGAALPGCS